MGRYATPALPWMGKNHTFREVSYRYACTKFGKLIPRKEGEGRGGEVKREEGK